MGMSVECELDSVPVYILRKEEVCNDRVYVGMDGRKKRRLVFGGKVWLWCASGE